MRLSPYCWQGLCKLRELKTLSLGQNLLSGSLPPCIGQMPKLKHALLSYNTFSGSSSSVPHPAAIR